MALDIMAAFTNEPPELDLAKIERYREQFLRLEGRDPAHEGPRMSV